MEITTPPSCVPWNKGKLVGQRAPFRLTVLQPRTLPTKMGRTNPSLTVPQTQLNETIRVSI
jgi:hypothetical protein